MRRPAGDLGSTPEPGARLVVRSAVVRFTVSSLVTLLLLTAGTLVIARQIAQHQALDEARARGAGIASRLAAPLINDAVRRQDPGAAARLDLVMGNRMRDGSIDHIKLWDREGRVIWSDERDLVGRRFNLPEDISRLFGTHDVTAELSDLAKQENAGERGEGELLEVYAGAFDADGRPVVFEAYMTTDQMTRDAHTIVVAFVPLVVGALALFLLVMLPLALSLARRVERAQLDRSRMMRHALLASDLERRRIAEDLHDGVIQDLAGLGYALPIAERELHPDGDLAMARATLSGATGLVRRDVAQLRALMTNIYPPDLQGQGLVDALEELVQTTAVEVGLEAVLSVDPQLEVTPEAGRLAYRVVREGLRNIAKHAHASSVQVEVGQDSGHVLVRVVDDGVGPPSEAEAAPEGHLGLRLLTDTITDFGGELELRAGTDGGASLLARFPSTLVPG
jgi:signal transduction histidine kinase